MERVAQHQTKRLLIVFLLIGIAFVAGWLLRERLNIGAVSLFFTDRYVASVNKSLPSLRQIDIVVHGLPAEDVWVSSYDREGKVKKISARFVSELGAIEREFYYDNRKVRYVYEHTKIYKDFDFKEVEKEEENWFYFDNGKMITWLAGPSKERKQRDEAFETQEEDILLTSEDLFVALRPRFAWVRRKPIPLKTFVPESIFYNSCEAGEHGYFKQNGELQVSVPANVEPNNKIGRWKLEGETLVISGSFLSDNTYKNLIFEENEGKAIAYQTSVGCGITIARDRKIITAYENTGTYDFEIYGDPSLGFVLRFPEEWIGKYAVSYADTGATFHYLKEDGQKNWLFDIFWTDTNRWQERDGETVLYEDEDYVWVGRPRPPEIPGYNGSNKEEFERMRADIPAIFATFEPPLSSIEE